MRKEDRSVNNPSRVRAFYASRSADIRMIKEYMPPMSKQDKIGGLLGQVDTMFLVSYGSAGVYNVLPGVENSPFLGRIMQRQFEGQIIARGFSPKDAEFLAKESGMSVPSTALAERLLQAQGFVDGLSEKGAYAFMAAGEEGSYFAYVLGRDLCRKIPFCLTRECSLVLVDLMRSGK